MFRSHNNYLPQTVLYIIYYKTIWPVLWLCVIYFYQELL
uniref:Uncharacterized protein n=1 Tax=Podoviridae sp. ctqve24 TaxID=2826580 RepID=A0A8S5MGN1_9CAUD|nr:MAG TPA: hypothetical protein [Podoviridae sp. ctqve24]